MAPFRPQAAAGSSATSSRSLYARGTRVGTAQRLQTFAVAITWAEYTIVYNASSGQLTYYVNGNQVSTATSNGPYTDDYDLNIGLGRDGYFIGDLAEIFIYNRALSSPELTQLQQYFGARYSGVAPPPVRSTPPVRSGGSPSGTLAAGLRPLRFL